MNRVAAGAGLLGVLLPSIAGVAVAPMWDMPPTDATGAEIARHMAENRTALLVAMLMHTTGVTLWFVFGAGVWGRLRQGFASACFAYGLIGFGTLLLAGFTCFFVLVYREGEVGDPRLLYDLTFGLLAMSGPLTAVALAAYAAEALRGGGLPRWTGWLAVIGAASHVLLLASFVVTEGFFSLEGQVITAIPGTLFLWIAATSVALLRSRASKTAAAPTVAAD